jgi:hypothetical protein
MRNLITSPLTVLAALALHACHGRSALRDAPALITNPTSESSAELARVVSDALNGAAVTIADDALTSDSVLIIERVPRRDSQGRLLDGRETDRPERFMLVKSGSRCVLVHERSGRRWPLVSATCAAR